MTTTSSAAAATALIAEEPEKWTPDFSFYEPQFEKTVKENDPLAFKDNVIVINVPRRSRTTKSALPADLEKSPLPPEIDPLVRSAVEVFSAPFKVVGHEADSSISSSVSPAPPTTPAPPPPSSLSSSSTSTSASAGGHHHHHQRPSGASPSAPAVSPSLRIVNPLEQSAVAVIPASTPLTDLSYEIDGAAFTQPAHFDVDRDLVALTTEPPPTPSRPTLFRVFPVAPPTALQTPTVAARQQFDAHGMQLLVEYRGIAFDFGSTHEPFFGTMFLYDWDWREKVSETFCFDAAKAPRTGPLCIFRVEQPRPTVCLVVILQHVLRGEYDAMVDPYFKQPAGKDLTRFLTELREANPKLAPYRQVFSWGAVLLFGDDGSLITSGDVKVDNMSKVKEELPSFLTKIFSEKDKSKSSRSAIPGHIAIRIVELDPTAPRPFPSIDPLLLPIADQAQTQPGAGAVAREAMAFSAPEDVVVPHLSYVNVLFLYPESLNFSNYKGADCSARNILASVRLMETDSSVEAPGVAACYTPTALATEAHFSVQYHQKKPKWIAMDEVKIQLPHTITPTHHLLVTFFHIECKVKKGKTDSPATILGYCAIPLLERNGDVIREGRDSKPVALSLTPSYMKALQAESDFFKWVDGGKPLFTFSTRMVSSIHTQDVALSHFLRMSPDALPPLSAATVAAVAASSGGAGSSPEGAAEDPDALLPPPARMAKIVDGLAKTPGAEKIRFLPLLLQKLLTALTYKEEAVSHAAFIQLLLALESIDKEARSKVVVEPVLESFVEYMYAGVQAVRAPVHECIVSHWITILYDRSDKGQELGKVSVEYSWFLFGVIFKDMVLTLNAENKLRGPKRAARFPETVVSLLRKLIDTMGAQIMILRKSLKLARELNASTAFFLRNALDILDRGVVFEMTFRYIGMLDPSNTFIDVQEHKFTALRIILDHDQCAQLNLPCEEQLTTIKQVENVFFQRHFLAGLLLRDAKVAMCSPDGDLRNLAAKTVLDVLQTHDRDPRLTERHRRARIAYCYFPFVLAAIDNIPLVFQEEKLSLAEKQELQQWLICYLHILQGIPKLLSQWWKVEVPRRIMGFLDLFPRIAELFRYPGKENCSSFDFVPLSRKELEDQPAPSASPVPSPSPSPGEKPASPPVAMSMSQMRALKSRREMLRSGQVSRAEAKSLLEERYASLSMETRLSQSNMRARPPVIRRNAAGSAPTPRRWTCAPFTNVPKRDDLVLMYKALCMETSLICLEATFTFVSNSQQALGTTEGADFLSRVFGVYTALFRRDQSQEFLALLFYSLQMILRKFKKQIFRDQSPVCQTITQRVMELCDSKNSAIRAKAASTLCNMITFNHTEAKNFSRMKLQCTIAISRLVVEKAEFGFVKETLEAVARFFSKTPLAKETQDLRDRLFGVVRDSISMKAYEHDREMTAELYHHISRGFLDSPDLRLTWLDNLAKLHKQNGNLEEYAQTKIMMAALVSMYVAAIRGFPIALPDSEWARVFPNFVREAAMPARDTLYSIREEICTGTEYSASGYEHLLKDAVEVLRTASNYEACIDTYQLLLPLHRALREYKKQADLYKDLYGLCLKVVEEAKANTRVVPNYYRIAFYGKAFGAELDGKQFVYKESCFVRIADITERIQKQYAGRVTFELLPNTKEVNPKELDPAKSYIQLGSVLPLRPEDAAEKAAEKHQQTASSSAAATPAAPGSSAAAAQLVAVPAKRTALEQHFNISMFVMEVPFTKSGKAHGELAEQWKKKVVLHVEGAFPHLKKRLPIVKKDESVVTPIRNATELINDKIAALQTELQCPTPNTKTLQIQLNGSLLACVNVGPLEICRVFLVAENRAKLNPPPLAAELTELTEVMKAFVKTLGFALKYNGRLIGSEQKPLQDELEIAYQDFTNKVKAIIGDELQPGPQ